MVDISVVVEPVDLIELLSVGYINSSVNSQ